MSALKKILSLIVAACLIFSVSGCAPSSQTPTDSITNAPTQSNTDTGAATDTPSPSVTASPTAAADSSEKIDMQGYTITITAWADFAPQESDTNYDQEMQHLKDIEAKYNCKFNFSHIDNWQDYTNAYITTTMSGQVFGDICWIDSSLVYPSAVMKGLMAPLDDYFDFSNPMWNQTFSDQMLYDGKHYGITNWNYGAGDGVFFNKRILDKYGLTSPYDYVTQNNWNWDTFLQIAQGATNANDGIYGLSCYGPYGAVPPVDMIYSNDASPYAMDSNGKAKFTLDTPNAIQAIQFCYDLWNTYKVSDHGPADAEWGYSEKQFMKGLAAMLIAPSYRATNYKPYLSEDGLGFVWLPKGPAATDYVNVPGSLGAMFMPPNTKYPKEVAQIITDYYTPQDWTPDARTSMESWFMDDTALDIAVAMPEKTVSNNIYQSYTWYRDNVLWTDMGIKGQTNPQTYIDSIKVAAQKSIDDTWAGK